MKKTLLFAFTLSMAGLAQAAEPVVLPELYAIKMSPNGKYVISEVESSVFYNVEDGSIVEYPECQVGNGNSITPSGLAVGSNLDVAVVMKNGDILYPESLSKFNLSYLHAITPSATRVCGLVDNLNNTLGNEGLMYEPFVADMASDGTIGEVVILPYPEKDFSGRLPQYCSAVWISDDGKTIVGQMTDYSGQVMIPIVYKEDASGKWSYELPSESLLNPNHVEIPADPGEFDIDVPDMADYMTAEQKAAYDAALQAYYESGYQQDLYPEEADYMTADKYAEYAKAVTEYNAAAQDYNNKLMEYYEVFYQVVDESVTFQQNAMAMSTDGKRMVTSALSYERSDYMEVEVFTNYLFDLESGSFEKLPSVYKNVLASQIMNDGTVIGSSPVPGPMSVGLPPQSYVLKAGASDFVPVEDYLAEKNPSAVEWMKDNLYHQIEVGYDEENDWAPIYDNVMMSGHVQASNDLTVMAGGVMAYVFSTEYSYLTYVLTDLESGLGSLEADSKVSVNALRGGVLLVNGGKASVTVYDLSGRVVFVADSVSGVVETGLSSGVYVVNATSEAGNTTSSKVVL